MEAYITLELSLRLEYPESAQPQDVQTDAYAKAQTLQEYLRANPEVLGTFGGTLDLANLWVGVARLTQWE
jgi:hypothetical protein